MNNISSEKNMPSDFWFMSYNYNTGKVLYINTLDVIDIFYDSARPTGIISSTSMLACGQIGIKKCFPGDEGSKAQLPRVHFP